MKNKMFLLILLLLVPFVVRAKECDENCIKIESVEAVNKSDGVEDKEPYFDNRELDLDVKLSKMNDTIKYKIVVENTSDEEYLIDNKSLEKGNEHISFSYTSEDDNLIIKGGSKKDFYVEITYNNLIKNDSYEKGKYNYQDNMVLQLSSYSKENPLTSIINPETSVGRITIVSLVFIISGIVIVILTKKKKYVYFIVLGVICSIPIVRALCSSTIKININVDVEKINNMPCTFDGEMVQGAEFAYGDFIYRYKQEYEEDESDWKLKWLNIEADGWGVIHKDINSGTVTEEYTPKMCTSINDKPIVSLSYTFYEMRKVPKMDVSYIDTSNVLNMSHTFEGLGSDLGYYSDEPVDFSLIGLENWDVSKVKNMYAIFFAVGRLAHSVSITDISKWDVSNVEDMKWMFYLVAQGTESYHPGTDYSTNSDLNIGDISNWNVSNVKDMSYMFSFLGACSKEVYLDLSKWDVSNVEDMGGMFEQTGERSGKVTIIGLDKWDVSNVKNMSSMFWGFAGYTKVADVGDISKWDVSNVEDMSYMFGCFGSDAEIINFVPLTEWDTKKVKNMNWMFDRFAAEYDGVVDIGVLNIYADSILGMFNYSHPMKATINLYTNPQYYEHRYGSINYVPFDGASTYDGSLITVNYSSNTVDIDDIIATKSDNSNVVKGELVD